MLPLEKVMHMKRVLFAGLLTCSGCFARVEPPFNDNGSVTLSGDAKGVRALLDGMNGMITNGKASPDQDTAHWIHRKAEDQEDTKRAYAPGFIGKLFGGSK